jgi:hypothetical protein
MTTTAKNRIMIFGPKPDGTYVVEFRTATAGDQCAGRRDPRAQTLPGAPQPVKSVMIPVKQSAAAVATSREDHRLPRSGRAGQHRR